MPLNKRFLVVDDNADARSLLTRTLLRKFPQSLITECGDATTAVLTARSEKLDAIVVHRAGEITGLDLVSMLRKIAPHLPVVYVSGIDRSVEAQEAGATAFLNYDAWLGLGTLVAGLIGQGSSSSASPGSSAPQSLPLRVPAEPSRR